jgi:hypothetical protein
MINADKNDDDDDDDDDDYDENGDDIINFMTYFIHNSW